MPGQLKKLFYNKRLIDSPDGTTLAEWKIAPWKVFAVFITLAVAMIILYAFLFTKDTQNFLGNVIFYAIVIILVIAAVWILGNKAIAAKQRITYFLIAFILLWVMYWVLSVVFSYAGLMDFYLGGYALWVILSLLAFMGAKRIDNNIDKNDVLFALLVFLVFVGANIPMTTAGTPPHAAGFLENIDGIITKILSVVKF